MSKWSRKVLHDPFFEKAKKLGYVSRAAFKLQEIQRKHKIIPKGGTVLDLGCAPGAWLQVACQELGPRRRGGLVLGIDIQDIQRPEKLIDKRVKTVKSDVRELSPQRLFEYAPAGFDVVLSDMLHFTSGNATLDVGISLELSEVALRLAVGSANLHQELTTADAQQNGILKEKGNLVLKLYEGAGTNEFVKEVRQHFEKITRLRPEATRKTSREFYLIAKSRT